MSSGVIIPLNDGLLSLIGNPKTDNMKEELIFELPTYESCCKSVRRWVESRNKQAHQLVLCPSLLCREHPQQWADIKTVASLLGHSGLRHTEKYTRSVDELKRDVINSLQELKF